MWWHAFRCDDSFGFSVRMLVSYFLTDSGRRYWILLPYSYSSNGCILKPYFVQRITLGESISVRIRSWWTTCSIYFNWLGILWFCLGFFWAFGHQPWAKRAIACHPQSPQNPPQTAKYWTETFASEKKSSNDEKAATWARIGEEVGIERLENDFGEAWE